MDAKFIVNLSGRDYPLFAGILAEAHERGLQAIETELIQIPGADNDYVAIVKATVRMKDGSVYADYGDASPRNTSSRIATALIRMASCVPLSAEILTANGWKRPEALRVGEQVIAYDLATDMLRWTPLRAVNVFPDPYPTVRMTSRSFSFVCTPDHSWPIQVVRGRRRLVKACELRRVHHLIVAAPAEDGSGPLTPREAAILGWLATDGNVRETMVTGRWGTFGPYLRATIYQTKAQYVKVIRELLAADGLEHEDPARRRTFDFAGGYTSECRPSFRWTVRAPFLREVYRRADIDRLEELPSLVLRLSQPAREAMLEAMLQAEGHQRGRRWTFCQRKPWVLEAFVLLATLEGRALGLDRSKATRGDLRTLRANRWVSADYLRVEPEGDQPVWCPTTDYGTWVMRFEGNVTITGNTRAKGRALRDAINVGQTMLEELPDLEDGDAHEAMSRPSVAAPTVAYRPEPHPRSVVAEAPSSMPGGRAEANGDGKLVCSNPTCGKALTKGQQEVSVRAYGQPLCPACQKIHAKLG